MKKLITTVGTSLITNNLEIGIIKEYFDKLKNNSYEKDNRRANKLKEELKKINTDKPTICAEIDSIRKIANEIKEDIEVYLIATDTILSPICAEYIQKWFENNKLNYSKISFYDKITIIPKLRIEKPDSDKENKDYFYEGFQTLIEKLLEFSKGDKENTIFNITGGYKGIIPIITIIAQLEGIKLNYLFEESTDLIEIGQLPVTFNIEITRSIIDVLNNEDLKLLDKNSKIFKELISYNLIIEENNKIIPSKFSNIFITYFKNKDKAQKDNLGYILEYILYYYFSVNKNEKYCDPMLNDKINLFFKPNTKEFKEQKKQPDGFIEVGDIDLELRNKEKEKVICEIKSLSGLLYYENYYEKQIYPRIEYYKPKEFHIYLYKITFKNKDSSFENMKLKTKIDEIKNRISSDFDNVTFHSRGFYIDMHKKNIGIDYTALLQKSFKEINWIDFI